MKSLIYALGIEKKLSFHQLLYDLFQRINNLNPTILLDILVKGNFIKLFFQMYIVSLCMNNFSQI